MCHHCNKAIQDFTTFPYTLLHSPSKALLSTVWMFLYLEAYTNNLLLQCNMYSAQIFFQSRCTNPASMPSTNNAGQLYGASSRCFELGSTWTRTDSTGSGTYSLEAGCYQVCTCIVACVMYLLRPVCFVETSFIDYRFMVLTCYWQTLWKWRYNLIKSMACNSVNWY